MLQEQQAINSWHHMANLQPRLPQLLLPVVSVPANWQHAHAGYVRPHAYFGTKQ